MRGSRITSALLIAGAFAAGCNDDSPTSANARSGGAAAGNVAPPLPIASELLTQRHQFTDDVSVQVRLKPSGRSREVINIDDPSRMAVVRFTIQPGVRFPWHSHPGLVMVAVTKGDLVFVYGDDCVQRQYPAGTAFIDPGFGNVHYAFNPTGGELVIVATFLGVPDAPAALTNPVSSTEAVALDAKCGAATAAVHGH
ncbi:MAG TPA: cupin domain-containing protein [Gemmatimonadaceae bacterium]|nr:cupin domain-containing protein [Gemmatimonadaceae bacterium]